jgi:hypothetical protein
MTGEAPQPSGRRLALQTGAAFVAAGVVTVLAVLPAEYGIDPTGFGRLTGLTRLAATAEVAAKPTAAPDVASSSPVPPRTDTLIIALAEGEELERKVWMRPGQSFVYSLVSDGDVYADFHGETLPRPKIEVMTYRVTDPLQGDPGRALHGGFTAPMEGFHGWFLRNLEARPVTVRVTLSGFYELRPYPPPQP